MIVGILFLILIGLLVWSIWYGRKLIRTEKNDAVFGNPTRALGGWHWIIAGTASILIVWFYFSWDAARAFFPQAGNELCQVAKLEHRANPIRSTFPLDERLLQGTEILQRDQLQIESLRRQLSRTDFNNADRTELEGIIDDLEEALTAQADPANLDPAIQNQFVNIAGQIEQLSNKLATEDYPGAADPEMLAAAEEQPGWGESHIEIPPLPETERGLRFHAASQEMEEIAKQFRTIRNRSAAIEAKLEALESRYESFTIDTGASPEVVESREDLLKQIDKIYKRVDNGKIFPVSSTQVVEDALVRLDQAQDQQQGSLYYIDRLAMPGGRIQAGNRGCSEQGSGRWLPKPSDTLDTFFSLSDPNEGYKGVPLLWYEMRPLAEVTEILIPDWIADLIPGDYPRHNDQGEINTNLKGKVYNFATGNYPSVNVPVPVGHVWDSVMRVLAGLFFGILFGVPLGLFMGLSRFAKGFFDPLIELYRPIPPLAWAPLILTIFGIHDDGKIFLLFMVAFAIMVISARTGASGTQLSKIHAAHSLGASHGQILRRVILPNSLPEILTGIRISIGVCWGTLVAAEMLAGTTGIGFIENVARKQSDYEIIWTTILLLGLLGLMFDLIMRWVIKKTIPWRGKG